MNNHFLIIGGQGNGNALLRGLLNAHSKLEVMYQWIDRTERPYRYLQWDKWIEASETIEKDGLIWGNDIVFQPIYDYAKNIPSAFIPWLDKFKVVWIFRRPGNLARHERSRNQHKLMMETYWHLKDAAPDRVIWASFEDLICRTESELTRICDFIGVEFEHGMFQGLKDTGNPDFNYGVIRKEKL